MPGKSPDLCSYPHCRTAANIIALGKPLCEKHNDERLEVLYQAAVKALKAVRPTYPDDDHSECNDALHEDAKIIEAKQKPIPANFVPANTISPGGWPKTDTSGWPKTTSPYEGVKGRHPKLCDCSRCQPQQTRSA